MNAISNLQLFTLISVIIFFIVLAIRTIKILRAPLNIRWEIMPVPHEKDKFSYGGSYYEEKAGGQNREKNSHRRIWAFS